MLDEFNVLETFGNFVKGTCQLMCPEKERIMREKEGLIHPLELDDVDGKGGNRKFRNPQRGQSKGMSQDRGTYQASPVKTVKCYSRSAAGQKMPSPSDLRPAPILRTTVEYLLQEVAPVKVNQERWVERYDFVTDRLRAVRQDMIIQGLGAEDCISLLQPMVWFHAFAGYRLCEEPLSCFDPKINMTHLQECLKRLLVLYECHDHLYGTEADRKACRCSESRHMIRALYLILNLGDSHALRQAVERESNCQCESTLEFEQLALFLSLAWLHGNYVLVCRLIKKLPLPLALVAIPHLSKIRRHALMVMSSAYSSNTLCYPLPLLTEILLWDDQRLAETECHHYGISVDAKAASVTFVKGSFNKEQKLVNPARVQWLDEALLQCSLPHLLMGRERKKNMQL